MKSELIYSIFNNHIKVGTVTKLNDDYFICSETSLIENFNTEQCKDLAEVKTKLLNLNLLYKN